MEKKESTETGRECMLKCRLVSRTDPSVFFVLSQLPQSTSANVKNYRSGRISPVLHWDASQIVPARINRPSGVISNMILVICYLPIDPAYRVPR